MTRIEANLKILDILKKIVYENMDLRFGQILFNYGAFKHVSDDDGIHIIDPFYEESEVTLNRLTKNYDELRSNKK